MRVQDLFLIETLLYRGDGQQIDQFDIGLTDPGALLGPGLYLTSDPAVAHDYTAARGDEKVFPLHRDDPESFNTRDLLHNYVNRLAAEFNEKQFKDEWVRKNNLGTNYSGLSTSDHRRLDQDMEDARTRSAKQQWQQAYDKVRAELPQLRVIKMTTGELRLVRNNRPATISVFDVPDDYIARTLHAERPLPDRVIAALKALWLQRFPNDNADLRNHREDRVNFDGYVQNYRQRGVRYAWRDNGDDEWWRGGKGENPSLDDLLNGTHGGYHAFRDSMFDQGRPNGSALIKTLEDLGYVGLEYDGGKRLGTARGAYNRGGGGRKHRAFVFWNTADLHRFRQTNAPLPLSKKTTLRSMPRATDA